MMKQFAQWLTNDPGHTNQAQRQQKSLTHLLQQLETREKGLKERLCTEKDPQKRQRLTTKIRVTERQRQKGQQLLQKT